MRKHLIAVTTAILIIGPFGAVVFIGVWIFSNDWGYEAATSRFLSAMKEKTTPAELREWAELQIEKANGEEIYLTHPAQDSQESVEVVSRTDYGPPVYLIIEPFEPHEPVVVFATWGSGFGHWGLVIGGPDLELENDRFGYYVKWDEGVFVWHEIQ